MFARSLNESEVEYYNDTMQRVAQCAQSGNITELKTNVIIIMKSFAIILFYFDRSTESV